VPAGPGCCGCTPTTTATAGASDILTALGLLWSAWGTVRRKDLRVPRLPKAAAPLLLLALLLPGLLGGCASMVGPLGEGETPADRAARVVQGLSDSYETVLLLYESLLVALPPADAAALEDTADEPLRQVGVAVGLARSAVEEWQALGEEPTGYAGYLRLIRELLPEVRKAIQAYRGTTAWLHVQPQLAAAEAAWTR